MVTSGHSKKRSRLRWVGAVAVVLIAYLAFSLLVIQFPSTDTPRKADAVIVLGAPDDENMAAGQKIVSDGYTRQLVISVPYVRPHQCSDQAPPGTSVLCFVPDPPTTAGEARSIQQLAKEKGWSDIIVVTWPTHIARSRSLIEQCYHGGLQMVDYDDQIGLGQRIQENIYQTGAFIKALFVPAC